MKIDLSEATHIEVEAEVRYWEDACVNGLIDEDGSRIFGREGDLWKVRIDLLDGIVQDWPAGDSAEIHYKVCDQGLYWLTDASGNRLAKWRGHYVPNDFLCHGSEGFGDYIILNVAVGGGIEGYRTPRINPEQWEVLEVAPSPPLATHVMNDIETLGTGDDALITSIGAVKFNANGIIDGFHIGIDPADAQAIGLKLDARTVFWWFDEERADARRALLALERHPLAVALQRYREWYGDESLPTWGNGASFDNVLMRSAFRVAGHEMPWDFRFDRCYRTMKSLPGAPQMERSGIHHDALDDARSQALHLIDIAKHLGVLL